MGFLSYLTLFTAVMVAALIYFGRNERLDGNAAVWVGIGILAIAGASVLVGTAFGVPLQAALHSSPVSALIALGGFCAAWPVIRLFVGAVNEPATQQEDAK